MMYQPYPQQQRPWMQGQQPGRGFARPWTQGQQPMPTPNIPKPNIPPRPVVTPNEHAQAVLNAVNTAQRCGGADAWNAAFERISELIDVCFKEARKWTGIR